jgi:cell wall-associated NlpC family hydrolase
MRHLRLLILMLVLASAFFVALVRPLPGAAGEIAPTTSKLTWMLTRYTWMHPHRRHHRRHLWAKKQAERKFGVRVANYAKRFRGVPYVWGGSSPRYGFDCSGFVRYVYQHFGISLPHSSYGDMSRGRAVPRKWLRPGDLVFFSGGGHVGIYVGGNRMVHSPHSGAVVHISTMTDWYSSGYYGGRRLVHAA